MKNVLVLCGGGGSEHDVSLISAKYFLDCLKAIEGISTHYLCIEHDKRRTNQLGQDCELRKAGEIFNRETGETIRLDYVIPCIHGPPGENGQIQSVFELMGLPYLGATPEGSMLCFNKVSTKIWLDRCQIATAPYIFMTDPKSNGPESDAFFETHQDVFVKASHQGSSVGCYHVTKKADLGLRIKEAFELSPYVLIEKTLKGRELEVAVFEYQGALHATTPGEIDCPSGFYSFEEKYQKESKTKTLTTAPDLSKEIISQIKETALKAFRLLKLKDMARVDFFLTDAGEIYINEINTMPGHTPISMFPLMVENSGIKYKDFLKDRIFGILL